MPSYTLYCVKWCSSTVMCLCSTPAQRRKNRGNRDMRLRNWSVWRQKRGTVTSSHLCLLQVTENHSWIKLPLLYTKDLLTYWYTMILGNRAECKVLEIQRSNIHTVISALFSMEWRHWIQHFKLNEPLNEQAGLTKSSRILISQCSFY